jgi:hypothetical protein
MNIPHSLAEKTNNFIFQVAGRLPFAGRPCYKFRVCFYLKGYPAN